MADQAPPRSRPRISSASSARCKATCRMPSTTRSRPLAGIAAGAGVVLLLLMIFFLLGKRAGKKRSAIVEIRRI